jgi:hypothetical protein
MTLNRSPAPIDRGSIAQGRREKTGDPTFVPTFPPDATNPGWVPCARSLTTEWELDADIALS